MNKEFLSVDAVLCISLNHRCDRRTLLLEEFAKSFQNKIEFILIDKDAENPERGCYNSHKKCAQIILDRGYKNALILEDDATFTPLSINKLKNINRFIEKENPDIFFLGGIVCKLWLTWQKNIALCELICAHAYILSCSACHKFVAFEYEGEPVDHFYNRLFTHRYCCIPLISDQQPDSLVGSDIENFREKKTDPSILKTEVFWENNTQEQYRQMKKSRNIKKLLWWRLLSLFGV